MRKSAAHFCLALAALTISNAHAVESEKRPNYCAEAKVSRIAYPDSTVVRVENLCNRGRDAIFAQLEAKKLEACGAFQKQNPEAVCEWGGEVAVMSGYANGSHCDKDFERVVVYYREPSQADAISAACNSVAACTILAFNKDDAAGIAWANKMSAQLGCK